MAQKIEIDVPVGEPFINRYGYGYLGKFIDYKNKETMSLYGGSLEDKLKELISFERKYSGRYKDLRLVSKQIDYSDSCQWVLYGTRYETDLEHTFRIEKEDKAKAEKDARDLREYEALKAKFEGK